MEIYSSQDVLRALQRNSDILKKYTVKRIGLFGSFARGEFRKVSDVDFLVEFKEPTFDNYMDLIFFLEDLFGRKVDLITHGSLSPYLKPYVETEVQWYEAH
jgi:predicted nucleotidyltransferase